MRMNGLFIATLIHTVGILTAQDLGFIFHQDLEATANTTGIIAGPDKAVWFSDDAQNIIGRITTSGEITRYPLPTQLSEPEGITAGPDGALWFTENYYAANKIGRITTAGVITEYPIPTLEAGPWGITVGPDGALWFTENYASKIGRITTSGVVTEYSFPTPGFFGPLGIVAGPDGALWFTETSCNCIGRITTEGVVTQFPIPTLTSDPVAITTGPDGALWFTEFERAQIGRITVSGEITEFSASGEPDGITTGPDGALWIADRDENLIGRISTSGVINKYPLPTLSASTEVITTGPDGALWFDVGGFVGQYGQALFPSAVLTASPVSGKPATEILLSGSGFAANETVNLYADSTGANLVGTTVADATGSLSVSASPHLGFYGYHALVGVGQDRGTVGVAAFNVLPQLSISPRTVAAGGTLTVEGYGFGAVEDVEIFCCGNNKTPLTLATTNHLGQFTTTDGSAVSIKIPAGTESGVHVIEGEGHRTLATAQGHVTVE